MHPINSDLVARVVTEDRRRAAAARHVEIEADAASAGEHREASAAQALLSRFRDRAHIELRHHA